MEKEDTISVQWAQEDVETSYNLLNNNNYLESRSRGISYMKYINGRQTGLVTFYVETAFYNGLLKERYKGG
jgi:hypothetical protein